MAASNKTSKKANSANSNCNQFKHMDDKDYKPVNTNKVKENSSPFTGVLGWLDNRLPIFRMFKHEYLDFQVPKNLNYFWSFGGILIDRKSVV